MKINRGLLIYALLMASLVSFAIRFKPTEAEMRAHVNRTIAAYAAKQSGDTPSLMKIASADVSGLAIADVGSRDWIIARSHAAEYAGERFSCIAGPGIVFCDAPDE